MTPTEFLLLGYAFLAIVVFGTIVLIDWLVYQLV